MTSSPARMKTVDVAVVGVGAMGRRHVRVLAELPAWFRVAGVFDTNRLVAREVAAERDVPCFDDEAACIEAADLVVVASPIEAHAGTARRALERGRHVLVEKPVCANAEEAIALVKTAARHGVSLFVGHSERFNPVVVALRKLVAPEDVRSLSVRRAMPPPPSVREHDVLLSLGIHDVDLAAYLTGSPVSLRRVAGASEDRAALTLRAASGALAHLWADRGAPHRSRTLELVTPRDVYTADLLSPELVRRPHGGARRRVPLDASEPLALQAISVARALSDGSPSSGPAEASAATGVDGARALSLALEARARLTRLPRAS